MDSADTKQEQKRLAKIAVEQDEIAASQKAAQEELAADMKALKAEGQRVSKIVENFEIAQREAIPIGEIGQGRGIEVVQELNKVDQELEDFMHELVTIILADGDPNRGDLMVETICVNGKNQPIMRGKPQKVRRKYVEALARSTIQTFKQVTDPASPDIMQMVPADIPTIPFEVQDDTARGRAWLKAIRDQPH